MTILFVLFPELGCVLSIPLCYVCNLLSDSSIQNRELNQMTKLTEVMQYNKSTSVMCATGWFMHTKVIQYNKLRLRLLSVTCWEFLH